MGHDRMMVLLDAFMRVALLQVFLRLALVLFGHGNQRPVAASPLVVGQRALVRRTRVAKPANVLGVGIEFGTLPSENRFELLQLSQRRVHFFSPDTRFVFPQRFVNGPLLMVGVHLGMG